MLLTVQPTPPIDPHQLLVFMLQCGLLLMLAVLLGSLAARFGMPAVVGELLAGVLLGPSLLSWVAPDLARWLIPQRADQFHLLDAVGQLSVLLLVGVTGVQVDFGLVRRKGATAARISVAGLVVPLALGIGAGLLSPATLVTGHGSRPVFALFLGVAMCVSAIPVISKTLMDMNLLHRNVGQLTLAAGMVDDALGWLLLSVVSAMATTGIRGGSVALSVVYLVGIVVLAATVGRPLVNAVIGAAGRSQSPGPTIAVCVTMVLLSSAAIQALGFEGVLGAFTCGILIGSSKALDPRRLAPLRAIVVSVLAPLFFATVGLRMDLTALVQPALLAAAVVVLGIAIIGKFLGAFIGAVTSRIDRWEALALGAAINARGVIQVVVASVGLRLGVLNTESYTIIILVAIATSLMAPPILRYAMSRVEYTDEEELRLQSYGLEGAATVVAAPQSPPVV